MVGLDRDYKRLDLTISDRLQIQLVFIVDVTALLLGREVKIQPINFYLNVSEVFESGFKTNLSH